MGTLGKKGGDGNDISKKEPACICTYWTLLAPVRHL